MTDSSDGDFVGGDFDDCETTESRLLFVDCCCSRLFATMKATSWNLAYLNLDVVNQRTWRIVAKVSVKKLITANFVSANVKVASCYEKLSCLASDAVKCERTIKLMKFH